MQPELAAKGIDVRPVHYTNHAQLVHALADVHTLLATVGGDPLGMRDAQLALIAAAQEAGVQCFAPSEYATTTTAGIEHHAPKNEVWAAT